MNSHTPWAAAPSTGRVSRDAVRWAAQMVGTQGARLPLLLVLGIAAALAEAVGIGAVMLLINLVLGGPHEADGMLGRALGLAGIDVGAGVLPLAATVAALIIAKSGFALGYALLSSHVRNAIGEDVRNRLHSRFLAVPYPRFRANDPARLMTILSADSWAVADGFHAASRIAINLCAIAVFGTMVAVVAWPIAVAAAIAWSVMLLALRRLDGPARRLGDRVTAVNVALIRRMQITLSGMRTIRAFGIEAREDARFRVISGDARVDFVAIERFGSLVHPVSEVAALLALCLIAGAALMAGIAPLHALTAVALLYRLQPQLRELESNRLALTMHEASLGAIRAVLRDDDPVVTEPDDQPLARFTRMIRFESVDFGYDPGNPILRGLEATIPARGITAITGPSGSGKTSIVALLLRLEQAQGGRITVDGVPIDRIRRTDWLGRVALAGQDCELITGTVAENIALARPDADADAIREAAELAGVNEFIDLLAAGYATPVGDQGTNLSGGQRQRIGIARAILADPDLLILDEATSALEPALEDRIMDALTTRFEHRAIVVISHRLSVNARAAYRIALSPPGMQAGA